MEYWSERTKNNQLFNIFQDENNIFFIQYNFRMCDLEEIYDCVKSFMFESIGNNLENFIKNLNSFIFLTNVLPTEEEIKFCLENLRLK